VIYIISLNLYQFVEEPKGVIRIALRLRTKDWRHALMASSVLGDGCCPQRLSPVWAELSSADLLVYDGMCEIQEIGN
jgi:hypothetical protein